MGALLDTDRAYAAALIDGEGCIGLYNCRTKADRRAAHYQLTVRVAMRSGSSVMWLAATFGCGTTTFQRKDSKNEEIRYYVWQARNRQAEAFLKEILPFLIEKADQAKLAIEFGDHRRATKERLEPHRGQRYPESVLDGYEEYVSRFKVLKRNYSDPLQLN